MMIRWLMLGGAALAAVAAFVWWDQRSTFGANAVFPPAGETRFPTVTGANLSRRTFTLPGDLEGRLNVLMVAFKQHQQLDVNTWLPVARDLSAQHEGVRYYELPVIERLNPLARSVVDNGMRAGIPDPTARATTITLYLDKAEFMRSLDLPTDEQIYVLLVDPDGSIKWRIAGRHTAEAEAALRAAIETAAKDATDSTP